MDNNETPLFDNRFGKKARLRLFWIFWRSFSEKRRAKTLAELNAGRENGTATSENSRINPEDNEVGP